jgi:hypothetical protein
MGGLKKKGGKKAPTGAKRCRLVDLPQAASGLASGSYHVLDQCRPGQDVPLSGCNPKRICGEHCGKRVGRRTAVMTTRKQRTSSEEMGRNCNGE